MKFLSLFFFLIFVFFSCPAYSQSSDLKDMYKQFTGNDLDIDKELESIKSGKEGKSLLAGDSLAMDTIPDLDMTAVEDSLLLDSESELLLEEPDTRTYFEKYVSGVVIDPYESELKQFSIDFSTIKTSLNYNKKIPDNYILSAGDTFIIDLWGSMSKTYELEVTNEGYIIVPDIGKIDVASMDYGTARAAVENKINKISGVKFSVRLGEVKAISIFVVGKVNKPGVYNVSPFSSLLEVLTLAGGNLPQASLRNIKLISDQGKERKVDLYSLLFNGEKDNIILGSGETIYVPLINKQFAIAGNVKNEGIFELKGGEHIADVLEIAGLTPFSETSRIEIERLNKQGRAYVESVDIKDNPEVKDGDIIRVFSTLVYNSEFVYLKGNFRHNRKMQYRKGMKLGDIIPSDEILKDNTNMNYGYLVRKRAAGKRDVIINFSPENVLSKSGEEGFEIFSRDTVVVFSLDSINFQQTVKIDGEIKYPGTYNYTDEMTVKNLLNYAGGVSETGDDNSIIVIRNRGKKDDGYFTGIDPDTFVLNESDSVIVQDYTTNNPEEFVSIFGEIKNPAIQAYKANMTVKDLLLISGGFTAEARMDSVEVASGVNRDNNTLKVQSYAVKECHKVKLQPNDNVFVRKVKDYGKVKFVTINGEVKYPGVYALRDNEELGDLIKRCGGYTDNAGLKATRIFRKSVRERQQQKIDKLKSELDTKLKIRSLVSGDANIVKLLNTDSFDSLKATGRLVADVDRFGLKRDFTFENQDSIFVPTKSNTVFVMGEVFQETAINYDVNDTEAEHYLEMAGGVTDMGDTGNIYIVKANGELINKSGFWSCFSGTLDYDLEEGDMVYVPFDYNKLEYLNITKDVTTILSQLSLSAYNIHQMTND